MKRISWLSGFWTSMKSSTARRRVAVIAPMESLEERQLLSVTALFIASSGELDLELDHNDNVRVTASAGKVLVEQSADGVSYTTVNSLAPTAASAVQSIVVVGGQDANTIDLNGVTAAGFPSLSSISVDGENGNDTIIGSPDLADSLDGGHGEDTISGQGGDDTILGNDGDDMIVGGDGNDSIIGGDGQDSITGDAGNDLIDSGDGNDTVSGGAGDDSVFAGNGEDSLHGDAGNDTLNGDGGQDTISGDDDNDSILGGEFADSLLGGAGDDTINGQAGNDTVSGEDGNDSLKGGIGNDLLNGNAGNDTLNGEAGNDHLIGGDDNDSLLGAAGRDSLEGGAGNDTLLGQTGNDTLVGGGGADNLQGGAGNDFVASDQRAVSIVSALTVAEGDSGTTDAVFTVSLTYASQVPVTVNYVTQNGTAIAGSDFLATTGQLTFAPGVTSQMIVVPIIGDTIQEADETFRVTLSNPVNAVLGQTASTATITNDDAASAASQFNIDVEFGGGLTASEQAAFASAAQRWEQIITGDLPDINVPGFGLIDDVRIDASGVPIDGVNGTLGQAAPDYLRPGSFLPAHGIMQFDTADLASLEANGQLESVILHEMGHVLGFGTIWTDKNLLINSVALGGTDPRFTGPLATQEYDALFGTTATSVPVEGNAGPGSDDSLWRESVFDTELMTPYAEAPGVATPISRVTIAQFADLGYQVDLSQADPYLGAVVASNNSSGVQRAASMTMTHPIKHVLPESALVSPAAVHSTDTHSVATHVVGPNVGFDTPIVNVPGQAYTGVHPPDTDGEAGPNHYVQVINGPAGALVRVSDKTGVTLTTFPMASLATSGPAVNGLGDGMVVYDQLADRWVLMEFSGSANGFAVYVSQTPDPTNGLWNNYFFATAQFPDYPKISVWPDAYYISTNESSPAAYALDRTNMLTGAVARPMQRFTGPALAGIGFQDFSPADLEGAAAPTTGTPAYFLRQNDDELNNPGTSNPANDSLQLWQFTVDFNTPANSAFTQAATLPVADFNSVFTRSPLFQGFGSIQQPNGTRLDPISEVLMSRTHYRNFGTHESLVGTFVTDTNNTDHAGVRWFELRRTGGGVWSLYQEGLVNPDNLVSRWMPSIDINGAGDIAIGYSVSGTTTFPSLRYIGRLATDPLGTMPQGEFTIINGTGSQQNSDRWGNYSSLTVDPSDDNTFWFTSEYALADGTWATQVASFAFAASGGGRGNPILDTVGDTLVGGDGNDTLFGAAGNDTLNGQGGNDVVFGGAGNDSALGGAGNDTMNGEAGNDTLNGQSGNDVLLGGDDDDTFVLDGAGGGSDSADGGLGLNMIQVNGTNLVDTIAVSSIGSVLSVNNGVGTIAATANIQTVAIDARGGNDTVTVSSLASVGFVIVNAQGGDGNDLLDATGANIGSVRLTLNGGAGNDTINGSNGGDTIIGGLGNDLITGLAGDDTIFGGFGNDVIGGGLGNDSIDGGDGADSINGQQGNDSVTGGNGNDTLLGADGNDTLKGEVGDDSLNGLAGDDSLEGGVGMDALVGGIGNDTLDGGRNDDTISGNAGDDKIRGDHGNDLINAGTGRDTVNGGDGDDTIVTSDGSDAIGGGDGNDRITSGNGNDTIFGGDGDDTILGGGGDDIILGGDGNDVINGQGGTDTVGGNQGSDVITGPTAEIHESFVLSASILKVLKAI